MVSSDAPAIDSRVVDPKIRGRFGCSAEPATDGECPGRVEDSRLLDAPGQPALFLCVMKTFSVMEVQHNFARVLKEIEAGHEVGITRRKELVARLLPPAEEEDVQFPDFGARARKCWGKSWHEGAFSDELLKESRGDR
jgi:antitoxin (DNA-binding transcriptional repressor) of toxin-antitoxin stability system